MLSLGCNIVLILLLFIYLTYSPTNIWFNVIAIVAIVNVSLSCTNTATDLETVIFEKGNPQRATINNNGTISL